MTVDVLAADPANLLDRLADVWGLQAPLPDPPADHVFLVEAFNDAGLHVVGEGWGMHEMRLAELRLPGLPRVPRNAFVDGRPTGETFKKCFEAVRETRAVMAQFLEYEHLAPTDWTTFTRAEWSQLLRAQDHLRTDWTKARLHRNYVIRFLCDHLSTGKVHSVCRRKGGGPVVTMPPEWWQLDDNLQRFRSCALDPNDPYNPDAVATHWIFVQKSELWGTFVAEPIDEGSLSLTLPSFEGVHLSPYIKLMIEVARITNIGPEVERQEKVESLKATLSELANSRGLDLSGGELAKMATFIREPFMKDGTRTVLANLKRNG